MPNASAFLPKWKTSDDLKRAFVGMQPQFKQMPPGRARSTIPTRIPSCAPRMAAT